MSQDEKLAEIVLRIRALWPDVVRVLLFGSQARGDARPDSDFDLFVIVPPSSPVLADKVRQTARLRLALRGFGVGFDLIVLTPAEFADLADSNAWWCRSALRDAKVLHEAA